ncbi:hypothetical protein [Flavobacterium lipolyticum]|uniref:Uncharacterized protein n=2 Tax=Flavobacterium TaxID=237 RepID=A0ABS8M2U8_9FLAO|nr:hypothetical protein [Flavobacterium sp. F-126]MCC9019130.1 hypothetical protein [Flavobacterium sp. F-126]
MNRKFIIGKLEIRKLILSDLIYLFLYIIVIFYYIYINKYNPADKLSTSFIISLIIGFLTISSPFGLRFRNVYFSIIWLLLSTAFSINNSLIAIIPLLTFFQYHLIRLIFWKIYNRELIPYETGRGTMFRYKSYFEKKSGDLKDKQFTKILLFTGILIIFLCFISLIKD